MKKIIITISIIISQSLIGFSQNLFFHAQLGHYIPMGGQTYGVWSGGDTKSASNGSMGTGPIYQIGIGYIFNKTFGVDVVVGAMLPSTGKGGYETSTPYSTLTPTNRFKEHYNSELTSSSIYLNPSLVIRGSFGRRIVPYGKMGMFIGLKNQVKFSSTDDIRDDNYQGIDHDYIYSQSIKSNYTGNASIGATSGIGLDFLLSKNKNFGMFIEANIRVAQWIPSKVETETITKEDIYDENGVSISSSASSISENINLVKELPSDYTGSDRIGELISLNGLGFKFGVKWFILTKKGKEKIAK